MVVADDGSRDSTPAAARRAGARVVRLPRLGKGQALTLAEREAPPGALLLCDADLEGDLAPLLDGDADLTIAAFAERQGGGFGIAKRVARALVRALGGFEAREPLSGQRALSPAAREACFPLAPGFGCEVRMTIDAARAGLRVEERELPLRHRATGRDAARFRPPRPAAARRRARLRADGDQPPRPAPAARRRAGRARRRARLPAGSAPASPRSRCSASPTTSGAARSAASAPTSARARPPAWRRRSGSRWSRSPPRARCGRRPSSRSRRTRSTSSTRARAAR